MTETEQARYARQTMLRELGQAGQQKLKDARVLLVGAGGLGSPAALYLAAAGVGTLGVCDGDTVEPSNLNRQIMHNTNRLGFPKADSAHDTLVALNSDIRVLAHAQFLTPETIGQAIAGYDFILDCTDSFEAKFMINDACVRARKPFCHAGISQWSGQLMTWRPGVGAPCFRCVFRDPPAAVAPEERGVIGAAVGVIGSLQAMEAIKYITGAGELLLGTLLSYDALYGEFLRVKLPGAARDCPACAASE